MISACPAVTARGGTATVESGRSLAWQEEAACRDQPVELFFTDDSTVENRLREKKALAICARCSVQVDCRSWIDEAEYGATYQLHGVVGGETPRMRSERRKASRSGPSRKGESLGTRKDRLVSEGTALLAEMHRADGCAWRFAEIVHLLHSKEKMTLENLGVVFGPSPRTGKAYTKAWASGWIRAWDRYGHLAPEERPSFWDAVAAPTDGDPVPQAERKARREANPRIHVMRLVRTMCGPDRWQELHRERQDELIAEVLDMVEALVESELSKMLDLAEVG